MGIFIAIVGGLLGANWSVKQASGGSVGHPRDGPGAHLRRAWSSRLEGGVVEAGTEHGEGAGPILNGVFTSSRTLTWL